MTDFTYTDLYGKVRTIRRMPFINGPVSVFTAKAPAGSRCIIIAGVAAGGWTTNTSDPGGGSAFARTKLTDIVDDEEFTIQTGSPIYTRGAGSAQGDTIVTRVSTGQIVMRAARGTGVLVTNMAISVPTGPTSTVPLYGGGTPGKAVDCIGDTKRDGHFGSQWGTIYGGRVIGDLEDKYSLGFGGRGAVHGRNAAAVHGGGGIARVTYDSYGQVTSYPPGGGKVMLDFLTKDPGALI